MRGVQTLRRLLAGTPLTPPLRGHPLRNGEGWRFAVKSESSRETQSLDQPHARFRHALAFLVEHAPL